MGDVEVQLQRMDTNKEEEQEPAAIFKNANRPVSLKVYLITYFSNYICV